MDRRHFLGGAAALSFGCHPRETEVAVADPDVELPPEPIQRVRYDGPNVVLIRFGGGVRRRETIADESNTWCPFLRDLANKGILFPNVEIASSAGVLTSHSQGTLYLMTGRYDRYHDMDAKANSRRFKPKAPTIFDSFHRHFDVPAHQTLVLHGEDRVHDEFSLLSTHHPYGVTYPAAVLSLNRFKAFTLRNDLANPAALNERELFLKRKQLQEIVQKDYRVEDEKVVSPELNRFWEKWQGDYGTSGLKNPRGDRALTALAIRAIKHLQPKLMMVNYQDTDCVHWGNPDAYFRAISTIDEGIREICGSIPPEDLRRKVFIVVPDCGRDYNPLMAVPFQHHLNSRSAREIFAVVAGPKEWVPQGKRPTMKPQQQISLARTVADIMGFPMPEAEADSLFKNV